MNEIEIKVERIALDQGNGDMKGAMVVRTEVKVEDKTEIKTEIKTASLPSRVGVGNTNMGALSLGGFEKRRRGAEPHQISFAGGDYLVGDGVERYSALLQRFDAGRYSDSPEVQALTYALLAELLDGGPKDVAAIVALPVDVMMAPDIKDTIKGIETWMVGEHRFACDGHETNVNIHAIKVMAQPVGAFFAWGLNYDGLWARDDDDLVNATVAVLDSGFSTLDLLVIKQGRIEKRFTGGDTLGVRRAAEDIIQAVKTQHGFTMSPAEADGYIRSYIERKKAEAILAGRKCDLRPVVKQALASLATRTISFIDERWGNAKQFSYVLMAGGGSLVLNGAVGKALPHAVALPDPVTANAVGLAKLAQRKGVFKGLE